MGRQNQGCGALIFELLKVGKPSEKWGNLKDFFSIFALENRGWQCIFLATVWGWVKNGLPVI